MDDALEFLQNTHVDLIITDIKMPKIDGITFIDTVLKSSPEMKFIVLSNFDDYSLVTKAFKLGIYDYILKIDFEPENFSSLLKRIVVDIYENKKSKTAAARISLKKHFWNAKLSAKNRIGVLKLSNYNDIVTNEWAMDREILNYGICNFIDEIILDYSNINYFQNNYDEFIFIINTEETQNLVCYCEDFFNQIIKFLNDYSKLYVVVGIYDLETDIPYTEQYSLASGITNYHFLFKDMKFFIYSNFENYNEKFDIVKHLTDFKNAFDKFDYKKCCELLLTIQNHKVNIIGLNQLLMFYKIVLSMVENRFDTEKGITDFNTASDFHNYIISALPATNNSSLQNNTSILEVINYIDKNYHKPLTLSSLSEEFQFEYVELSRKLKHAIGMSFKKYITSIRMQEAINLIKTTDFKITEIAEMVGYLNYEHFSRSFKHFFDKWPNEIRKSN